MAEMILHAGLVCTNAGAVQAWLAAHAAELAAEHGIVCHRLRPTRPPAKPTRLPGQGAQDFRIVPVATGGFDSSFIWAAVKQARRDGEERAVQRVADRFVVEVREQLRHHARIVLSGEGFGEVLVRADRHLLDALARLSADHHVRVVAYLRPQNEVLELAWRRTGCRSGQPPSVWLTELARRLDYHRFATAVAAGAPGVDLHLRAVHAEVLPPGGVVADFAEEVLGLHGLPDTGSGAPDPLSLALANMVWGAGAADVFDGQSPASVSTALAELEGAGDQDERLDGSRRLLQAWCHARFGAGNATLAEEQGWRFGDLVPAVAEVEAPADLEWLDEAWRPSLSVAELASRHDLWRAALRPAPLEDDERAAAELLDLACGPGNTVAAAAARFGARAVGIEHDVSTVLAAQRSGRRVFVGDIRDVRADDFPSVHYVVLDNALEHLASLDEVRAVLSTACRIASRCVYVRHPSFEGVDYLARVGCKLYWTDWPSDHVTAIGIDQLRTMALAAGAAAVDVVDILPIVDADDPRVLPLGAPPEQRPLPGALGPYDERLHGPKPRVRFDEGIHYAHDIVIRTRPGRVLLEYVEDPTISGARPALRWSSDGDDFSVVVLSTRDEPYPAASSG